MGQRESTWTNLEPTWSQPKANMDLKIIEKPWFLLNFFNILRKYLEASGNAIGDLGGRLGEPLGTPGEALGTPWGTLGSPWGTLGGPWEALGGPPWRTLGFYLERP